MSSDYTGGLFQHVPFQGMLWIREVIRTGLYQPQIQAMFVILGISVFGLCYPIARLILLATYRKLTHAKHNLQRTETLTGDSAELPLDPPSDGRSAKLVEENAVSIVLAMTTTHPRLSNTFSEDEHTLMEDGKEYLHGGQMIGSLPNTQPKAFKPPRSHPNTIVDRGYKRRIPILYVVSVLFAACFTAHLVSLIMAIRNEQNISETLDQIPILAHSLSVSVGQFGNFAIDVAFNLTERHITSDTDQANKGSHLRPLVKGVQDLAAEALACLIQQCHAENSTQTLLWSSNASDTKGNLAKALLTDFDLIIRRLINLNNAALTMTDDFIHNVTRDWYSFQKALLALTSTNVELSVYYNRSQNSRLGYPLFTQTRTVICDYLTVEHLNEFSDCNDVTQFLDRMFDFVENVQFMLPQKRLGTAVQFTTIPRALGIEQLVAKLLPAATDIPGRGAKESMNLENSFDALEVGTVQDYLNEPGPFYFHTLARVLDKIGTERAVKLSQNYAMLGQAQAAYARKYHVVNHTLSIIEANKEIIAPLALLIKNVSIALDHLNAMQSMQIVTMLDQIITVGWPRILPKIDEHMIPFLEGLLNDLIPFPGLRTIYHQALSPLCPDPVHLRKTSQVAVTSINPELGQLGFSLF
ncbi:hypothetical protein X801_07098, partial [Opisthorchis viverrini]